jgi:hypothetical protein
MKTLYHAWNDDRSRKWSVNQILRETEILYTVKGCDRRIGPPRALRGQAEGKRGEPHRSSQRVIEFDTKFRRVSGATVNPNGFDPQNRHMMTSLVPNAKVAEHPREEGGNQARRSQVGSVRPLRLRFLFHL